MCAKDRVPQEENHVINGQGWACTAQKAGNWAIKKYGDSSEYIKIYENLKKLLTFLIKYCKVISDLHKDYL